MKPLIFFLSAIAVLHAEVLLSPVAAAKNYYGETTDVEKRSIMLSAKQVAQVETRSKVPLSSKIVRYFECTQNGNYLATGVLLTRKVRTKNAVVLYLFEKNATLKTAEVIAFDEPPEYLPNQSWFEQLHNAPSTRELRMGSDVATITGATLSARSISEGARVARAIFEVIAP